MLDTLRLLAVAGSALAMGCTGLIDGGETGSLTPEQAAARAAWINEAHPVLMQSCASCHNGTRQNIAFLEGADQVANREDLLAYEPLVVNLTAPQSSRIITKGQHEGPAFNASQTAAVLQWIQKEKDAAGVDGGSGPKLETAPFIPLICTQGNPPGSAGCPYNDVALDDVGAPGAKIRFTVQALGSGLYFSNMRLEPGPTGAYIEHPLFVSKPMNGNAKPDTIDRFFSLKMNIGPTATDAEKQIAGGAAAFVGFVAGDPISIYFKIATMFKPEMMGGGGTGPTGCKVVAQFAAVKANFTAPVGGAAQACIPCHSGGNMGATGALNLTGINNAANDQNVCNQVLIRTNLTTPDSSGIFLAPDPGATHPFRFNAAQLQTFKNNIMPWIQAERTAP